MAKKFDFLESIAKHPGKWMLGAGALTAAKFAVGGYFIGKGMQAVKDKRAAKKKHKTTKLNLGGKYGSQKEFLTVKGGLGNKAKFYTAQGLQGAARHAKRGGKFIRKHHKYATTAVGGAAAWDIIDSD